MVWYKLPEMFYKAGEYEAGGRRRREVDSACQETTPTISSIALIMLCQTDRNVMKQKLVHIYCLTHTSQLKWPDSSILCFHIVLHLLTQMYRRCFVHTPVATPTPKSVCSPHLAKPEKVYQADTEKQRSEKTVFPYTMACFWYHLGLYGFTLPQTVFVYCHM